MNEEIVIPLAAIGLPAVLVPMILAFRQGSRKREHEHIERMKALETGQPIPGESNWPQALVLAAIGAGVPIGAFLFTFLAYVNRSQAPSEIWIAPAVASFCAVACAGSLGSTFGRGGKRSEASTEVKPAAYDPDAYDVVGRRG